MRDYRLIDQWRPWPRVKSGWKQVLRPLPQVVRCDIDRFTEARAIAPTLRFCKPLVTMVCMMREVTGSPGVRRRPKRRAA